MKTSNLHFPHSRENLKKNRYAAHRIYIQTSILVFFMKTFLNAKYVAKLFGKSDWNRFDRMRTQLVDEPSKIWVNTWEDFYTSSLKCFWRSLCHSQPIVYQVDLSSFTPPSRLFFWNLFAQSINCHNLCYWF